MKHPIYTANYRKWQSLPDKEKAEQWIEDAFRWIFCIGQEYAEYDYFQEKEKQLWNQFSELLLHTDFENNKIVQVVDNIKTNVVLLHEKLEDDLKAIFEFDPAAKSRNEVLISYPGFFAIAVYRLANFLWRSEIPVLPRLFSEYVHGKTGIDIHPGATIGERFFIDHGTGIVVGETAIIGDDVKIYQGVTLGALIVKKEESHIKRHPTIGNQVTIYANATILGGQTLIGNGSIIGGNVWITNSIPENSLVYHKSEVTIKSKNPFPEPLNFVI